MWTVQKLTWLVFWRKMKWGESVNLCAYVKKNKRRKHKKCDFGAVAQLYFSAVAASNSPKAGKIKWEDCQDVMLIAPNNGSYLVHMKKIISAFHARRPKGYTPRTPSSLYFASKLTECIVRSCYGLDYARIIQYDAPVGESLERNFLECDFIRSDAANSTIFVGEIKSRAAGKLSATAQLRKRCKVLVTCFKHVIPMVISVKMSSMEKTQDLLNPVPQVVTCKGFLYLHIPLTLKDVLDYAVEAHLQYDEKLIMDAHASAKKIAERSFLKEKNKQQQKQ
jgi:hypothetical protein